MIKLNTTVLLLTISIFILNSNILKAQWSTLGSNLYFNTGFVGIGTTTPTSRLTLNTLGWSNSLELNNGGSGGYAIFKINTANDGLLFRPFGTPNFFGQLFCFRSVEDNHLLEIFEDGHVNIGTPPAGGTYTLNVGGKIRANEIVVNTTGADFVFENDYKLKNLGEVESYIKTNKHLPDIPKANEVQTNGVSIGEMQTKLLQKIEELTLYVIKQEKEIQELKQQLKK